MQGGEGRSRERGTTEEERGRGAQGRRYKHRSRIAMKTVVTLSPFLPHPVVVTFVFKVAHITTPPSIPHPPAARINPRGENSDSVIKEK